MKTKKKLYVTLLVVCFYPLLCSAQAPWEFKKTFETKTLVDSPFFLNVAADVNKNRIKELIVADFGQFGDHIEEWKQWKRIPAVDYNLFILEWNKDGLEIKLHKQWNRTEYLDMSPDYYKDVARKQHASNQRNFKAFQAKQMVPWQIDDRTVIESIPPYFGLEWGNGKYVLHDGQVWDKKNPEIGSWIFPWLSPSCYQSFPSFVVWPRECLLGIRDLWDNQNPRIVTILEKVPHKQIIRVRKFSDNFPVEWELPLSKEVEALWWQPGGEYVYADRLNQRATMGLPLTLLSASKNYLFVADRVSGGYKLIPIKANLREPEKRITSFDLMDIYLRKTKNKETDEFWGYRRIELHDPKSVKFIRGLRSAHLQEDLQSFAVENIEFEHHEAYLGVGYFIVQDFDGDGIDEIILTEETAGKLKFSDEVVQYNDIKDYIHILKWNGQKYQTMWVSPPYTKRGTKFLVEDIKNTGKKQLVVLSPYGTIQIWEKQ